MKADVFKSVELLIAFSSSSIFSMELKIDNLTIAEILRVYLNNQGIKFAAWRKEHPDKPIIFRVESSGKTVKKAINEFDLLLIDKLLLTEMIILINLGIILSGYDGVSKKLDLLSIFTSLSSKKDIAYNKLSNLLPNFDFKFDPNERIII